MRTKDIVHGNAGFTVIELTALLAILAVLTGSFLPAVQRLQDAAARMARTQSLAGLAGEIEALGAESRAGAQTFFLDLGAAVAGSDTAPAAPLLDPLSPFCDADAELAGLRSEIERRLDARQLPAVQRKQLTGMRGAIDELLPAVQRLGDIVRAADGPCPR
jgi:type II secretory pathway pseudopilin PulG